MGWSYNCNPSFDKKALIAELTAPNALSPGYTMLRSMIVGNNHWYTYSSPDGSIAIGLNLMAGGGRIMGWGYKGISEDMGPCEKNCPLSLLNACTEPRGYAIEWRERVRAYHAAKKTKPAITEGSVIQFGAHCYKLLHRQANPRKGWVAERVSDSARYRMPLSYIAKSNFLDAA